MNQAAQFLFSHCPLFLIHCLLSVSSAFFFCMDKLEVELLCAGKKNIKVTFKSTVLLF